MLADRPQVRELSGGRLRLSHGPIDVVLRGWGTPAAIRAAYRAAARRFGDILPELCRELPRLRTPIGSEQLPDSRASADADPQRMKRYPRPGARPDSPPHRAEGASSTRRGEGLGVGGTTTSDVLQSPPPCPSPTRGEGTLWPAHHLNPGLPPLCSPVGRRMAAACRPFAEVFVTPMAAVAGSVADELMAVMLDAGELERAYVNDGGDIAVHCSPGAALDIGVAGGFGRGPVPSLNGSVRVRHGDGIGGIATSGARGRSFSLGIADSVSVLAANAAIADAAATLVANAVDIDHPAIFRRPASALDPDSDLGDRLVTVSVGDLPRGAVLAAIEAGRRRAADYLARGLIVDAALMLRGEAVGLLGGAAPASGKRRCWIFGHRQPRPNPPPLRPRRGQSEQSSLVRLRRRRGEGLGVGGISTSDVLESPPPCPSPTSCRRHASGMRGEGTLRLAHCLVSTASSPESGPCRTQSAGPAPAGGLLP